MKWTILLLISLCFTLLLNAQVTKTAIIPSERLMSVSASGEYVPVFYPDTQSQSLKSATITSSIQITIVKNVTAGTLSSALTTEELATVTNLTLTGTVDARDFKTMRDNMPLLAELDLSGVTVAAYTGTEGTNTNDQNYVSNKIPARAFVNKYKLLSIDLPSSITSIGEWAFESCNGLTNVVLPNSVTTLDGYVFFDCNELLTVIIPPSVTSIGWQVFSWNDKMTTVNIPASVSYIASNVFLGCSATINVDENNQNYSSLDGVFFNKDRTTLITCPISKTGDYIIPNTVINIGGEAFNGTLALSSIYIPASVLTLNAFAFGGFGGTSAALTVDENNQNYSMSDGVLFNKDKTVLVYSSQNKSGDYMLPQTVLTISSHAFIGCQKLTSIILSPILTTIEYGAFSSCNKIKILSIPSTVSSIGSDAFAYCSSLEAIYVDWATPLDLNTNQNVFRDVNKSSCKLYVPHSTISQYAAANQWKDFTTILEKPAFTFLPTSINLAASGGSIATADLSSEIAWTASSNQTWLTVSPTSGTGNQTLTFTAGANPSIGTRTAIMTVSATGYDSQTITITQAGANIPLAVTAGGLASALTSEQLATITKLTLTGTLDARDFKTMRDNMPLLAELDLSGVSVVAYTGTEGTSIWGNNNYSADAIPEFAFMNANWQSKITLTSVTFPSNMTSIGQYAFRACNGLTVVSIPPSVTTIGNSTFDNCNGMTSVLIPSSVNSIGDGAFRFCTGLINVDVNNLNYSSFDGVLFNKAQTTFIQCPTSKTGSLAIPSTVFTIEQYAFAICKLTGVTIPTSVTTIKNSAFYGCKDMTSISIPSSVTIIEPGVFVFFEGSINVDSNNLNYSSLDGVLLNKNQTLLIQCPNSKTGTYNIPSTVGTIGSYAFSNCTKLNSINIPASVKKVESYSFRYCNSLSSIIANSIIPINLINSSDVFGNVNKTTCTLNVPYGSKAAYQAASQWQDFTNIVEAAVGFNLSATTISVTAAAGSTAAVNVTANVAWKASSDQTWLTVNPTSGTTNQTLTFTAQVNPSIGTRKAIVTVSATGVESQTITITQAGANIPLAITAGGLATTLTAEQLAGMTSLTLTGTIDARDFKTMRDDMPLLAELDLSGTSILAYNGTGGTSPWNNNNYPADAIPEAAFMNANWQGKNSLTSVILPSSLISLGQNAFYSCNGLTTITFPSLVTTIGDDSFSFCKGLTSVFIPSLVTLIGDRAFMNCTGLINVDAGNPNYSSLDGVLFNKGKTTLIQCPISKTGAYTIPESVITIGQRAFYQCATLTSISMPSTLSSIGDYAFYSCTNLDGTMTIPINVSSIGQSAFSFCRNLDFVNIPSSVTNIGGYAFYNCGGNFTVDNGNPNYSSQDGILFNKTKTTLIQCGSSRQGNYQIPSTVSVIGPSAFSRCDNLTGIIIPTSVTTIGTNAFWGCVSMTGSISIPSSVNTIGNYAFSGCTALTALYSLAIIPVNLSSSQQVFYNVNKTTCTLHVPYGSKAAYQAASQWQDFTNIVEAANGFNLSASSANIDATAGSTATVNITANVAWTANSAQTWLTVSPTSGTGNQTLTFTVEANPSTTAPRVAIVTVSASDVPLQTVTVTQQLTIDPTKLDAFEPDNAIAQASTITSGVVQQHSIYPIGDVDYASFDLTNAPAEVNIRFFTASGSRQIQVIAPDGTTVLTQDYEQSYLTLTQNGKYYIRAWNPDNQLTESYQLSLNIKPIILDKYEPDNTWEQATAILPFFEQDDHTIKANGDVDYVKFTVSDAPRTVYVDVTDSRKDCYNFGVWLYDTNGTTELKYSSSGANNCGARLEQILNTNGTYYLKVAVPQGNNGTRNNYIIKLTTNGAAPVVKCNSTDSLALVAVYDNLNGNNWNRKQGWKTDRVQNWQGVILNAEGRVTKLNLTANNLRGNFPTEIGNLSALRQLTLGNGVYVESWDKYNDFYGKQLPASLSNLVNLEILSLDQLNFNNEFSDVFAGMTKLRELYIGYNYFTNTQLPTGIYSCIKLERLEIQYNNFSQLPNVTGLTNLQSFNAYYNRFTFEDLEPNAFISGFNYSPQRKVGQPMALNPAAGSLVTQTIAVGGTANQYQWYKNELPVVGQTSNTLRIENVSASDAGIYQLRVTNTLATQLILYSEPITLYQNQLPIYKALEAFYNSTGGPNWNNKTNWLSDAPLTTWYGIYQSESGQYTLDIYSNNMVGQLPVSMGDLTLFTYIYIRNNPQLTGSIPESIGNLVQLQSLSLYSNGISGVIPSTIGNLKNLNQLNLRNNQLSGSVPATIATCTSLRYIYLYNNALENLPNLSAMSNLSTLNVYNNRFEFDDLEPTRTGKPNLSFSYNPQKKFGKVELYNKQTGEALTLTATCGGSGNLYQWYKDGNLLTGKTANTLVFDALALTDRGSYVCKVTNPSVSNLTLESEPMSIIDPTLLDAFEPDNTIALASTITSGIIQQHSIYPVGDVDYASFELTNAPADVEIKFNTTLAGRQLQLLAADGTTVLYSTSSQVNTALNQNGKYYIKAYNSNNQLIDSYQLSLNIKPIVVDKYEPDNTWEQANAILPFFEQDDHTIKANGDVDFVKFTVSDAPRTIYVDVTDSRKDCYNFGVWLYDTNGTTELKYSSSGANNCGARLEHILTTNGTYFLKVAVPQGNSGTRNNYTIKLTTNGVAPVVKCNLTDSLALVAVYDNLNGNNWNRKQGWKTDRVQNWQGVTMNAEGRVTKLNLTANNLRGNIPTEIGNLIALRWLNLGNNRYRDSYNSQNDLNGKTIPQSIANLVNLEVLSLDQLYFYTELPDVFSGMVNLRELYLQENYFTNTQLPTGILSCSKLERFEIQFNNFSQLPNVTGLINLQSFQAYYNRFTFEDLEPNTSIFGFNYFSQRKVGQPLALNPVAGSLVTQTIAVGGTANQYQWYKNDQPVAGQTSNTLRIENVSLTDAGIYHLRISNTVATQLILYSEPITLYQNQLPIYKALEAFYNSTGGPNWNNKTNWLSDAPLTTWYGIYQSESGQYTLDMYSNNIVGQLPVSMGDLTLFTYIYIANNSQLTGSIPESIGNLVQLQSLNLYSNGLSGVIPSTIGNLKNLNNLNLENNQLSGSVPSTIATCTNLRYIYLYNNTLENLPNLSAMSNLYGLYIYNNRFEFDDLAPTRTGKPNLSFSYYPQKKFGQVELYNKQLGETLTLTATVGGTGNLYQWYKDGNLLDGKTSNTLVFAALTISDPGSYVCKVTNPLVPNLILESETMSVLIGVKTIHVIGGAITSNNGTLQMTATILPEDATTKNLLWTVENSSGRATISAGGLITAILNGTVTVRAKATDGSEVEGSAQVVISGQVAELEDFNLIKNGDFVPDGNLPVPWEFWSGNGGVATFVVDGVSVSTPVQDNISTWNYGLSQSNLQALPNVDYVLTFTAWASAERKISVTFQDPNNNWLRYGTTTDPEGEWANLCQWGVNLTIIPKVFTLHVNFNNMLANTIQQIAFQLAHTSDVVYIDKVKLVSATDLLLLGRPVAHAGADQSVNKGTTVTLDGSASSDPDGNQLTYKWTAPVGITLSSTTAAKTTFTAPDVLVNTNYTFSLVVNDGTADSPADQVVITVNALQDVISPAIVTMMPMNQSIVPKNLSQLVVVFSEGIKAGTGCVKLYNQTDVLVETICSGNWVISGNTLTVPIKPLLANTTYYILIESGSIMDMSGNYFSGILNKNQFTFKTEAESVITHFTTVWTGNGVDHANINIYSAKIDGVELETGDEIGIFDGSICVGVGTLTGPITSLNTLDIAVSKNDGSGNGYTSGNSISYKLYDKSKDMEMNSVTAIYSNTDPSWSTDGKFTIGATAFAELSGLTKVNQDIILNTGWNIISANVIPANLNLKDLFQSLIDAGKLKKVMDEAGKTIENFGAFGGWKNNIGNLNSAKGYKVNVLSTSTLSLEGTPVSLPFDLALAAGWNIISYPSATAQDAKALVQSLIDAGKLKKVMDEAGKTIENFGAFGGWKNNIGNFLPGKGYKVNVLENCTLTIPTNANKTATIVPEVLASTHFTKAFKGNGTDHTTINLVNLQASGLQADDEIGIFDGKLCVGSAMIGTDQLIEGTISISASANDGIEDSPNGFIVGNRVSVKLYRESLTYPLTLTKLEGQDIFDKNASLFAQVSIAGATGINDFGNEISFRCYPNPFTEQITIEIQSANSEKLEVNIYDLNGKLVRKLNKDQTKNSGILVWDGRNDGGARVVPGTYLINANGKIEKVVMKN